MNDPIEQLHKDTNARIRAGAKAGKYWVLRSEDIDDYISRIVETTTSGAIGGFSKPMLGNPNDPAFGGRNRFTKQQLRFAVDRLLGRVSSE